jgi:hypothetical protein
MTVARRSSVGVVTGIHGSNRHPEVDCLDEAAHSGAVTLGFAKLSCSPFRSLSCGSISIGRSCLNKRWPSL